MPVDNPVQTKKEGILLINKPSGMNSFRLVVLLRRLLGVKKIGHTGTLDPFATGVMILLVGKRYTTRSDEFLVKDKAYAARLRLGVSTDSYDREGQITEKNDIIPTIEQVEEAVASFQGSIQQTPPMFSAKKIDGKKLYELARKGQTVERPPVTVQLQTELVGYEYPFIDLLISCSKGTYIRSIAHDLGKMLGCGAHLDELCRTKSGHYSLHECIDGALLEDHNFDPSPFLRSL